RNILENPRVVVMVINREKSEGYRIYGTAELLTSGDLFERVAARQEQRKKPRPRNVVRIKIENINQV
ncbi:MAG: pyridoxamine 5'-phosphate oxidase family protein, partial [Dehalococcoidia bacterium]|nr:pyridoxamine 5'-phosphate oxidase family protein [Dehalococcoidia bacterium]